MDEMAHRRHRSSRTDASGEDCILDAGDDVLDVDGVKDVVGSTTVGLTSGSVRRQEVAAFTYEQSRSGHVKFGGLQYLQLCHEVAFWKGVRLFSCHASHFRFTKVLHLIPGLGFWTGVLIGV